MRIKLVFAWYDLWIGAYYDRAKKELYFMIPFIGIKIQFGRPLHPLIRWAEEQNAKPSHHIDEEVENYQGDYFADSAFHDDCGDR